MLTNICIVSVWCYANKAIMNIYVQVFYEYMLLFLLNKYLETKLHGHSREVRLTLQETARLFPKLIVPFALPPALYEASNCSTSLSCLF